MKIYVHTNVEATIIHNSQKVKQLKYSLTDEWINTTQHTQAVEYK